MSDPGYAAYNYVQATPAIATSGVVAPPCFEQMASEGYAVVVNLLPADSPYYLPGEAAIVGALGLTYVHVPVDFAAPSQADFDAFEAAMLAAADRKVWVHCAANYRVSAFMALFGQLHLGWSAARAAAHVDLLWQPDAAWQEFTAGVLAARRGRPAAGDDA